MNTYPISEGDKLPGLCCPGHDAEILLVLPKTADAIYWFCENPECPATEPGFDGDVQGIDHGIYSDVAAWKAGGMALPFAEWLETPEAVALQ